MRHLYVISILLLTAGCGKAPDIYQPPNARRPLLGPEGRLGAWVNMNDATAGAFIVRDISKTVEDGTWRWAYRHPQLRFYLRGADKLRFVADVSLAEMAFQETGPIALTVRINDHDLTTERLDKPGERHIEKPVPAGLLLDHAENIVSFETDKLWVSKHDGAVLSFVLTRAGFIR